MEFGSKEWFEVVEENSTFPSDFAFYISTDRKLQSVCLYSNVENIGNVKCKLLNKWSNVALIEVANCKDSQEYFERTKRLKEVWS